MPYDINESFLIIPIMKGIKVAVVGGYGGMGRIFARLFKGEGAGVTISGPTESKGVKTAEELGVKYVKNNVKAVLGADVVVVTVPIAVTADVIREVAPHDFNQGGAVQADGGAQ
jgi:prephenate dehydrogenase